MTAAALASLVLNYDNLSDANYLLKLGVIISATKGSDLFGTFPEDGSPEKLEEKRNQLQEAHEGALDKSMKMIERRKSTRKETDRVLYTMGSHIQSHCQGDPNRLEKSGFDMKQPRVSVGPRTMSPPASPTTWYVETGNVTGELKFKVDHVRGAFFCEIWCTDRDPAVESNWPYKGGLGESEGVLNGFQPGSRYALRSRFVGKGGTSDWSNTIIIVAK